MFYSLFFKTKIENTFNELLFGIPLNKTKIIIFVSILTERLGVTF